MRCKDDELAAIVGKRLRIALAAQDKTVFVWAQLHGFAPKSIYRWRLGKSLPDTHSIPMLCMALGVSADWLLGLEDDV